MCAPLDTPICMLWDGVDCRLRGCVRLVHGPGVQQLALTGMVGSMGPRSVFKRGTSCLCCRPCVGGVAQAGSPVLAAWPQVAEPLLKRKQHGRQDAVAEGSWRAPPGARGSNVRGWRGGVHEQQLRHERGEQQWERMWQHLRVRGSFRTEAWPAAANARRQGRAATSSGRPQGAAPRQRAEAGGGCGD